MAYCGEMDVGDIRNFASASFAEPEIDKFFDQIRARYSSLRQAPFRYDPAIIPKQALLDGKRETVPDFLVINGCLAMSDRARLLVERFEPGLHQFVPVDIRSSSPKRILKTYDHRKLEAPYFLFAPQTNIDAVCVDRSFNLRIAENKNAPPTISVWGWDLDKVVLRKSMVDGHHIWIGLRHLPEFLMFSDSIFTAIKETKLQKLMFTHVREE